ncbi:MAG: hypothetical protein ACK5HA_14700 [Planctomycetaceae bacterium]|jgi:hypothetical protein
MFYWVYDLPTWQFGLLTTVSFVLLHWVGVIFVRPLLRLFVRSTPGLNDVVGYILSCFCVFYGLLLGLIAVTAYQNSAQTEATVTREAAALSALYEDVGGYPQPHAQNLRWLLRDYTRHTIRYAWPLQRRGITPVEGGIRVAAFEEALHKFEPQTPGQQVLHAESLRMFNNFLEHRRMRLLAVTTGIPPVMWFVVAIGAIINLAMVWLFDMRFTAHLFLGGLLAAYLGAMIFLIAAMDNPFRGEVSISPTAFESLFAKMVDE